METNVFIYCLNANNIPTYIGKTINPKNRKYKHKKNFPNEELEILDIKPRKEWKFWECHYISLYKSWGFNLRNKTSGGDGGDWVSIETKNKIKEKLKGRKHSKEAKMKMSKARKGIKPWNIGLKCSDEIKVKLSKLNKGKKWKLSDEQKIKQQKSHFNRILSEETKKKMSESHKGKETNIETKKLLSEKSKLAWIKRKKS